MKRVFLIVLSNRRFYDVSSSVLAYGFNLIFLAFSSVSVNIRVILRRMCSKNLFRLDVSAPYWSFPKHFTSSSNNRSYSNMFMGYVAFLQ